MCGLLCKAEPEKIVKLQEKSIAYLVGRAMYEEAKHVLDKLIGTRTNGWKITRATAEHVVAVGTVTTAAANMDRLQPFADQAKRILYQTLPSPMLHNHINDEKGIINFAFMVGNDTSNGYLHDSIDKDFQSGVKQSHKDSE